MIYDRIIKGIVQYDQISKGLYNTIEYQRDCTIRSNIKGIVQYDQISKGLYNTIEYQRDCTIRSNTKGLYNTIRYQRDCTIRSDIKGIVHVISSVPLFKEEYECSIKADLNKKKMNKIKLFSRLKTGICFSLLLVYWVKKLSVVIGNRTGPSLMEGILEIMFKS